MDKQKYYQQIANSLIAMEKHKSRQRLSGFRETSQKRPPTPLFGRELITPQIPEMFVELLMKALECSDAEARLEIDETCGLMKWMMFLAFRDEAVERARCIEAVFENMRKRWKGTEEEFRGLRAIWLYCMGKIFPIEFYPELREERVRMREQYKELVAELKKLEGWLISILSDSSESIAREFVAEILRRRGIEITSEDLSGLRDDIEEVSAVWRRWFEYQIKKLGGRGPQQEKADDREDKKEKRPRCPEQEEADKRKDKKERPPRRFWHPDARTCRNAMISLGEMCGLRATVRYAVELHLEFGVIDLEKEIREYEKGTREYPDDEVKASEDERREIRKDLIERTVKKFREDHDRIVERANAETV